MPSNRSDAGRVRMKVMRLQGRVIDVLPVGEELAVINLALAGIIQDNLTLMAGDQVLRASKLARDAMSLLSQAKWMYDDARYKAVLDAAKWNDLVDKWMADYAEWDVKREES